MANNSGTRDGPIINDEVISPQSGFTLVELLAAMAIALPMLILIVTIIPRMLKASAQVEATTQGTFLAAQKMDAILALIRSKSAGYGFAHDYTQAAQSLPAPFSAYSVQVVDTSIGVLKTVSVLVSSTQVPGYSVRLDTRVAQ